MSKETFSANKNIYNKINPTFEIHDLD